VKRSGFVAIVGRPNTGKSTLTNALVGTKVAITSSKPQTTRHTIRGIVNTEDSQIILVDTPGIHRPRTLLGERLNELVRAAYADVEVIAMCLPANEECGTGDQFICHELSAAYKTKRIALLTKIDTIPKAELPGKLIEVAELAKKSGFEWDEIVPVSALTGEQLAVVIDVLSGALPEGGMLYLDGEVTDEPQDIMVAELIREAALEGVRDELPHSIAVMVEEIVPRTSGKKITDVRAFIYVERPSQKSIVIGTGGARLKDVGTRARHAIEAYLGTPIFLDLHVKVAKEWQSDPKALNRLGW